MDAMSREDFEASVDDALDSLPLEVAAQVADSNTVILVEEEPEGGEEILGVFDGVPLTERGHYDGFLEPGRIVIFRGPLTRMASSREDLEEQIRVTVLHEIGHLFGIEEDRLHELGWG
ncbi:metallopeptidase family protein [Dermabacter vaginalis]|uniref:Metallopeptidase family protein n=1 Tax=Dermabacter vaginalis TaxID=1630135 RepID=A0ABX6A3T0_9MICO|nr:metallopeptidase family protein [Dermabacter vaginalis]QEU11289.1 metallopeptidase family protein [Dermabacter vaginalis]